MATDELQTRIITLTSDFGTKDWFVAVMKGTIAALAPHARTVDISHDIPAFDIGAAAYVISQSAPAFPAGTVHVAVVDPTVGTERRPVIIEADGSFLVGPDNGLFSILLDQCREVRAWVADKPSARLDNPHGPTFDGRDLFCVCAAHIAEGKSPDELGTEIAPQDLVRFESLRPEIDGGEIRGALIYADRFGNLISNITGKDLEALAAACGAKTEELAVSADKMKDLQIVTTYANIPPDSFAALVNSSGRLEICGFKRPVPRPENAAVKVFTRERKQPRKLF